MNPNTTYYIDKRGDSVSLDGLWRFCWTDNPEDSPEDLTYDCTAELPASGFRCLEQAGVLPDPYYGDNSHLYHWVDKKIWYFRRSFRLPENCAEKDIYLCFDGVGYFCRVWLNGKAICTHEGMFGGPVIDLKPFSEILHFGGENDLIVEVTPPIPQGKEGYLKQIVPWNIRRDSHTSNGDFIVFGIWRSVRIEIVEPYHLSRPYLFTNSLKDGCAELNLTVEIVDPQVRELDCVPCETSGSTAYQNAFAQGIDPRPTGNSLSVRLTLAEKTTGKIVYASDDPVELLDLSHICSNEKYRECFYFKKTFLLSDPQLWWPNTLGEPFLYTVRLQLSKDGRILDTLTFDTGIRSVDYDYTAGDRYRLRWEQFRFTVNGRPIFLKGMNWTPVDFLYDVTTADLRWALEMAKNAGYELIRVWSGGGMPEDDRFYALCDELGLMVMQDNFIANQTTDEWDRRVLASQVSMNLYRIRNHPSLILHTGGNENNPYALGNDACMWVISREIADIDPSRRFWRTTPDKGSAHIYRDMEPVWYRKVYGGLPFVGESGIHSFPNAKTFRQQISAEEYAAPLDNIFSEEFKTAHPQLINHFSEFHPARIPRMLSRASAVCDMKSVTFPDICEATQMSAYEFYQIMIQSMRENYPVCGGIMPWVFKRPWATVAIQVVDGLGDPTAPYYAVKNAYAPMIAELALREVTYAPGETFVPDLRLLCDDATVVPVVTVRYELYSPALVLVSSEEFTCAGREPASSYSFEVNPVKLPADWNETYFFQRAVVSDASGMIHQSFYWCRILERLRDPAVLNEYRSQVQPNPYYDNGPWLKPQLAALPGKLSFVVGIDQDYLLCNERRMTLSLTITNGCSRPLFPIHISIDDNAVVCQADDDRFFLPEEESRDVKLNVRIKDLSHRTLTVILSCWGCDDDVETIEIPDIN